MTKKAASRQKFEQSIKKTQARQIWAWPLIGAILLALLCFLWFAFVDQQELALEPLALAEEAAELEVVLAGDILIDANISNMITAQGYDYPLQNIKPLFEQADLSYAQLDTVFSDQGAALPGKLDIMQADPDKAEILLNSGLDLLGLASLHMMDYDLPALQQSRQLITGAGLSYIGAGDDLEQAKKPYILEQDGIKLALFNYCDQADTFYSYDYPRSLAAKENEGGINDLQLEAALADIAAYKDDSIIIVNLYWGNEFAYSPTDEQKAIAHSLIDGGADIIVGYSPHSIQSVEVYNNGLICYSLGNLLYAQTASRQAAESIILQLKISPLGWTEAIFHSLLLAPDGQPNFAQAADATAIYERIKSISANVDAEFVVENGLLVIK